MYIAACYNTGSFPDLPKRGDQRAGTETNIMEPLVKYACDLYMYIK